MCMNIYLITCGKNVLLIGEPMYSIPVDPGLSSYSKTQIHKYN